MLFPPSRVGPARHSAAAHLCPSGQCRPGPGFSLGKHTTDLIEKEMLVFAWTREWALALVVLASVGAAGCGYNTIQTYDEQVTAAGSQIKVQLQRRAHLLPQPGETGEGDAKQEETGFTAGGGGRGNLA